MPRTCSICTNESRPNIDAALVAGVPQAEIAQQYGVSKAALSRHRTAHLAAQLTAAATRRREREEAQANGLLSQVEDLYQRALRLLDRAEEAGSLAVANQSLQQVRETLKLMATLTGQLAQAGATNITIFNSPEWTKVTTCLVTALTPYPEARSAVIAALGGVPLELPAPMANDSILAE